MSVLLSAAASSPLVGIPVDELGVFMYPVDSRQAVVVEVTADGSGCRVVAVQSVVKLCNQCDLPLRLRVQSRQGVTLWTGAVAARCSICLPISLRDCYSVSVTPAARSLSSLLRSTICLPIGLPDCDSVPIRLP